MSSSSSSIIVPTSSSSSSPSPYSAPGRLLASPNDAEWLSPHLCILRSIIEAFAATPNDVEARRKIGGMKHPPQVGQVAIRCVHCKHLPLRQRYKGSEAYPSSIKNMHQCVRNFQRNHFRGCQFIPADVRQSFDKVQSKHTQSKSKANEYWAESCADLAMVDRADGNGIVFSDGFGGGGYGNVHAVGSNQNDTGTSAASMLPAAMASASAASSSSAFARPDQSESSMMAHDQESMLATVAMAAAAAPNVAVETTTSAQQGRPRADTFDMLEQLVGASEGPSPAPQMLDDEDDAALMNVVIAAMGLGGKNDKVGGDEDHDDDSLPASETLSRNADDSLTQSLSQGTQSQDDILLHTSRSDDALLDAAHEVLDLLEGDDDLLEGDDDDDDDDADGSDAIASVLATDDHAGPDFCQSHRPPSATRVSAGSVTDTDPVAPFSDVDQSTISITGASSVESSPASNHPTIELVNFIMNLAAQLQVCHSTGVSLSVLLPTSAPLNMQHARAVLEGANNKCSQVQSSDSLSGILVRKDLALFGRLLFFHLAGEDPTTFVNDTTTTSHGSESGDGKEERAPKLERTASQDSTTRTKLRDISLPVSLCIVIENLLQAEDNDDSPYRYHGADELHDDLRCMLAQPNQYLFDAKGRGQTGQLIFPWGQIYGREEEIASLMQSFDRTIIAGEKGSHVVFLSGFSGVGKTMMIEQLRIPLAARSGRFISGKFDKLRQKQPLSVIFTAVDDFCKDVLSGEEAVLNQIRLDLQESLGLSTISVLEELIPNLRALIDTNLPPSSPIGGMEALNRMVYAFRALIRSLATPSHPVVLFLDDLQWADAAALELISSIVSDQLLSSLLFVGSYRANEVENEPDHPFHTAKQAIEAAEIATKTIRLENLSRDNVNSLICDTLRLLPRYAASLSDAVYTKTGGNPMFTVQFIRTLWDENLLKYSAELRQWTWDEAVIKEKEVAENVAELLSAKMRKFDERIQWLLKIASCFGCRFDSSLISALDTESDEMDTGILLDTCLSEGLLCRLSKSERFSGQYRFSHDSIQQAAYSLIPVLERAGVHLSIGRTLQEKSEMTGNLESILFVVVDQLSRGADLITDPEEKIKFAWLCLQAGEKAMAASTFVPASLYLLQGSAMLCENNWEAHYELSLRTFVACAQAQYVIGEHDGALIALSRVFAHAKNFEDQLDSYCTLLNCLGAQGKLTEAVSRSLDVLARLGETMPAEPTQADIMKEFGAVKSLLSETSPAKIVSMPEMADKAKLAAMKLCYYLTYHAFQGHQQLLAVILPRMIQMSLKYGMTPMSAVAFGGFGTFSAAFGKYEEAVGFARISTALLDRYSDRPVYLARVYATIQSSIYSFTEPIQSTVPALNKGYTIGMANGDINACLSCLSMKHLLQIQSGSFELGTLVNEISGSIQEMRKHSGEGLMLSMTLPTYQAALNLSVEANEDLTLLSGSAMNQEELLQRARELGQTNVESFIIFFRMWLGYIFGRYELAAEMAEQRREISKVRPLRGGSYVSEIFYSGLIAVEMAKRNDPGEWEEIIAESIATFTSWTATCEANFRHKLRLLEAENLYYLCNDGDGATVAFRDAIALAGETGFINDQALASERAGIFYTAIGDSSTASQHFQNAHTHYLAWGATNKANDVLTRHLN